MTPARIIRSHRRTVALVITREGDLLVRAPYRTPEAFIERFIDQKRSWIEDKQAAARARSGAGSGLSFDHGTPFLYRGEPVRLAVSESAREIAVQDGQLIFPRWFLAAPRRRLTAWYKARAKDEIIRRARELAQQHGFTPASIRITGAKSRWGSCGRGRLNFSWRLMMLLPSMADYVIVHELAHLSQPDHSPRFWAIVGRIVPEYKSIHQSIRLYTDRILL